MNTVGRVIKAETDALSAFFSRDGLLELAVISEISKMLAASAGVVTTGVGKCSYIAGKAASTFSSLHIPARYIHPTEASHGDLGSINFVDTLLVYSYSGGSRELSDIMIFCKRLNIEVIGITAGDRGSLVFDLSKYVIKLPILNGDGWEYIAPTISTTLMLAISDAMAVAAAEEKGIELDDFLDVHPGGLLGKMPRGCGQKKRL